MYWPETGTELPSVRVMWDPTPIKSSSSIWKQTLLLIILSMVNLLFGGVITYRTYSSQGIRMSTKFLIESSPKNMIYALFLKVTNYLHTLAWPQWWSFDFEEKGLRPGICVKYFLSFPQKKPVTRENWDKISVYFSILPNCQVPNAVF